MIKKTKLTNHMVLDRSDRAVYILLNLGLGEIIKETHRIDEKGRSSWQCLTNTGVLIVMDEKKETIITLYVASQPKVSAMYKGNTPTWLLKVVKKNKKHAKLQNEARY